MQCAFLNLTFFWWRHGIMCKNSQQGFKPGPHTAVSFGGAQDSFSQQSDWSSLTNQCRKCPEVVICYIIVNQTLKTSCAPCGITCASWTFAVLARVRCVWTVPSADISSSPQCRRSASKIVGHRLFMRVGGVLSQSRQSNAGTEGVLGLFFLPPLNKPC